MKAQGWQQINDLFQSAAERAPEERTALLDEACHGDKGVCREVESLIGSHERAQNFIETPIFEVAPELLTNERAGALIGELIGHYRIEALIGLGGMGEVYLARDARLGRQVTLKLLTDPVPAHKTQRRSTSGLPNSLSNSRRQTIITSEQRQCCKRGRGRC